MKFIKIKKALIDEKNNCLVNEPNANTIIGVDHIVSIQETRYGNFLIFLTIGEPISIQIDQYLYLLDQLEIKKYNP